MGSSGCGKTSLISCIIGTGKLDSGDIRAFGDSVGKNISRIGYMPQESALVNEFTISEIMRFYGIFHGVELDKIEKRTAFICEMLELHDTDKRIGDFSGGQQRRISFAVALVNEPELLILDEPTVGVDAMLRTKIWSYLNDIAALRKVTVLITTHYIEEARLATHVGLMRKGILLVQDTTHTLLQQCGTSSLEGAFLQLSEQQEQGQTIFVAPNEPTDLRPIGLGAKSPSSVGTKLRALIMKDVVQLVRNPG